MARTHRLSSPTVTWEACTCTLHTNLQFVRKCKVALYFGQLWYLPGQAQGVRTSVPRLQQVQPSAICGGTSQIRLCWTADKYRSTYIGSGRCPCGTFGGTFG